MASQSLYRKWRSQNFSDMVGQEPIIHTLKNALNGGSLAHAYLFTGPRGTGKTSTARLLAKTINCPDTKDGEPCNVCEQCREITAGNSFNVIEIDAASNRGIDSIRDLREKVMMPPSTGKYKVYILDEAHMLTTEAFNALLKTLEEPPPHAIFVLATTDVHKMLPTVLSRCQRFDFKRFTTQQIVHHLNFVAGEEHIELDRGAAELIARAAAGGMRDALSLLDQAIAYAGQHVSLAQVQTMLGVADPRAIQKFILHIAHLESAAGLHLIHELVEAGADLRQVNLQVAEFWRAMMLEKAGADIATIIDGTEDEVKEIKQVAQLFTLEELTACARLFAQNDLVQKNQGTPQLGLELALLACLELHRREQGGQLVQSVQAAQVAPPTTAPAQSLPAHRSAAVRAPVEPVLAPQPPEHHDAPLSQLVPSQDAAVEALPDWDELPPEYEEFEPVSQAAPGEKPVPVEAPAQQDEVDTGPTLTVADVKERWEYVKRRVKTVKSGTGARIAAVLNGYSIFSVEGTRELPVIVLMANATFHYSALQKKEDHDSIEWALKIELQRECSVRLLPPGSGTSSRTIPPPNASNYAAHAAMTLPPLQSAHVERPAPPPARTPPQEQQKPPKKQEPPASRGPSAPTADASFTPPLARNSVVRENTTSAPAEMAAQNPEQHTTRLQSAAKKVKGDPIVQEVARMFKAEIKDIQLK
jgi:DNA polymerase III subunit gamma/tau